MNKKHHLYTCDRVLIKVTSVKKKEKRGRKEKKTRKVISSSAMSNKTAGKASSFSVTCNLLSQFIKEKGRSPVDLNLAISIDASMGKMDDTMCPRQSTMNYLLPGADDSETDPKNKGSGQIPAKSMELFPQLVGSGAKEDDKKEHGNKQLTIFYGGKVLVYDNFPVEKANDLIALAGRGNAATNDSPVAASPAHAQPITSGAEAKIVFRTPSPAVQTMIPPRPVRIGTSDLPIARKASLHRFLEKRKDRVNARAPYLVNKAKVTPAENRPWLELSSECSK